jgi:hypothetical protein
MKRAQWQRYSEGDWFAVPLRNGGYAPGVVARRATGGILLGYFFGPRRASIPPVNEVVQAAANDAVLVERFGDLGIIQHEWHIIGLTPNWNRDSWPVPHFVRKDPLSGDLYIVEYSDSLQELCCMKVFQSDAIALPQDGIAGYGAVEIQLTKLLA